MTATIDSEPIVIDSSGWLEYITGDDKAHLFAPYFESHHRILVPVIVLYEVRKILVRTHSETKAHSFQSQALLREVIYVDDNIAMSAATISLNYNLAMTDALIYATAERYKARLITSDAHFNNVPEVTVL